MTDLIVGAVAQVVSDRELIFNRGSEHGVEVGSIFKVLEASPVAIKDPETGEDLGAVQRVKVYVRAHEVADRFTIARTFRKRRVKAGGAGTSLTELFAPARYETRTETLDADDASNPFRVPNPVRIGDTVEEALSDEADELETVTVVR